MAEPDNSAFSRVLSAFRTRLSPQDIIDFRYTTFNDLKQTITDIQKDQVQRRGIRNLNKIRPFLNGLGQYAQVIEVFVNVKPDILAFVWGPIKLCLQIASRLTEAFDALLDAYEKIGKSLPIFSMIDRLFLSNAHVQQVLADVYEDILDFHKRAIIFFRQSAWKLAFKVTLHTFGDMFGDVTKKLERSKELLLQSANVAHFHEAQEARLIFSREIEALTERTKKDRMLAVIDWLSPTSSYVDHEELQEKRREFPDTTRWIFEESCMRDWLRIEGNANSMFWICGIPGAGKTVLFSSIVDEIGVTIPKSQVVYFYCKNRDPTKRSFHEVFRSLIAQLLHLNPISLDYLHDLAVESVERHPSTFKTYQDILENISTAHNLLFIGIDGLDECEEAERRSILSLMQHILNASSHQANVKIFLTSQRVQDVQESLKGAIRFDVKHHHVKQDIQNYVHRRSSQLCKKFGYSLAKQESLIRDISAKPEGMFLLARLIMDNLMDQDSIEDLEGELCTDTLPNGIDEAYGRILARLRKCRTEKSQQRITRVLEIILTARRPLKIQELQGALSIHIQDMSVDLSKRRSLVPFGELCGPLVEVHADNVVSLVHPTARRYLTQYHSGPYIGMHGAEIRMANLCATYLTFECFSTNLQEKLFCEHVTAGAFAFQEYATLNWLYHLNSLSDADMGKDDEELASLNRACQLLELRHCEFLSAGLGDTNPGKGQQDRQISRQVFARLQACYEAVHSISDSEECYDSLPYLLQLITRVRSVIEELLVAGHCQSASLTEAYGASIFKCSILACPWSQHGFKNKKSRDEHQEKHQCRVYCNHEGCDYSILGYSSKADLTKHLREHGYQPSEISFPKVQRSSLTKSLGEAIDQNNYLSVRSLAMEVSALPSRDTSFLLRAAKTGSFEALKALIPTLGTDKDLNFRDRSGRMVLHYLAENGNEETTKLVIHVGAEVDAKVMHEDGRHAADHGYTPLMISASRGHSRIVRLLVSQDGRQSEIPPAVTTPLQLAAKGGHVEVVQMILDIDGAVYAQHKSYMKAIRSAALREHEPVVRLLLERGRELNAEHQYTRTLRKSLPNGIEAIIRQMIQPVDTNGVDTNGKTRGNPLQLAASRGKTEEVLRLLEAGADINHCSGVYGTVLAAASAFGYLSLVQRLLDKGANINVESDCRGTALYQAVSKNHEAVASFLIGKGADVNLSSTTGIYGTALTAAAGRDNLSLVQQLLDKGADINAGSADHGNALQQATCKNHKAVANFLIEKGADVNISSPTYGSALTAAAGHGNLSLVQQLLDKGADINAKSDCCGTALQKATCKNHKAVASFLIKKEADVNLFSDRSATALAAAAGHGDLALVQQLLDKGADVDGRCGIGGTGLQKAVAHGHERVVALLLEHKADVNVSYNTYLGDEGFSQITPCQSAVRIGHEAILDLLLRHGADSNGGSGESALGIAKRLGHEVIVKLLIANRASLNTGDGVDSELQSMANGASFQPSSEPLFAK